MNSNNKLLAHDVSVIVFSRNRGQFLNRMAGVLNNLNFGGTLIIADASEEPTFKHTNSVLNRLNVSYNLIHISEVRAPDQNISNNINQSIIKATDQVNTPYAMLTCDDDIPCPSTLDYFAEFLTSEQHYSGIVGEQIWLNLNADGLPEPAFRYISLLEKFYSKKASSNNRQKSLHAYMGDAVGDSGYIRAINFFKRPFTIMFALIRTETLKYLVPDDHEKIMFPHFSAEYNWFFNIAISGNIKKMNLPHIFRQLHTSNLSIKDQNHPYPDFVEAISSESWCSDVKRFLNNISCAIQRVDDCSIDTSKQQAMEILTEIIRLRISAGEKLPIQHRLGLFFHEIKYLTRISRSGLALKLAIDEIKKFSVQIT